MKINNVLKNFSWLLAIAIIAINIVPVAAVNPGQQPNTGQLLDTEIVIWSQWTNPLPGSIAQAFTDYASAHPGISFTFITADGGTLFADLDAAFLAGTAPDIIVWGADIVGDRALAGQLVDLRDMGVTETALVNQFGESATSAAMWRTGIYGIPLFTEAVALVYNKNLVTSQYLPTDPLDFSALYLKASQFRSATGKPLICNQGMGVTSEDAYHVAPIFFGFGVPEYIDSTGTVYANIPAAINAGTWIDTFHLVSDDDNDYGLCVDRLINGNVGMWWTGPWALPQLNAAGLNYGIIPMGKPFNGVKVQMITTATIGRGTADVALDLIQYISNTENSIQYAVDDKFVPANQEALLDPIVQAIPEIKAFGAAAQLSVPFGSAPFHYCQWEPIGSAVNRIWNNVQTPGEALNQAQSEIEACVQPILDLLFPYHLNLPLITR